MAFASFRLQFILEMLFNGPFILLYSLQMTGRIPPFLDPALLTRMVEVGAYVVPVILAAVVALCFWNSDGVEDFFRRHIFSLVILVPLFITFGDKEFAFW